jgi:serine/threonine protein kinase
LASPLPRAHPRAEASILSHLHHPAIIRHIESFEEDGHLCIVTEFAERGDLAVRLEERRGVWLSEAQVLDWLVQMALALLYIHKKKILHR